MNLTFNAEDHRYFRDGIEIPGVTRCLDHAGVADYSMIRKDILERSSEIGKLTHVACHYHDDGGLDWDSVPEFIKPRVHAWVKFVDTECFKPFPDRIEYQTLGIVNGMPYGMRIDRAGLMRGRPAIVEIKCTAEIMSQHGIQLAGYSMGLPMPGELDSEKTAAIVRFLRWERYVVQLRADGTFRLKRFNDRNDANIFTAALAITTWKLNEGVRIRDIHGE